MSRFTNTLVSLTTAEQAEWEAKTKQERRDTHWAIALVFVMWASFIGGIYTGKAAEVKEASCAHKVCPAGVHSTWLDDVCICPVPAKDLP